jgi:hypothetical protein
MEMKNEPNTEAQELLEKYTTVRLDYDLEQLTEKQRAMIPLLIEAGEAMDRIFWKEAYGDKTKLLTSLDDPALLRFVEINYGPWDRLAGEEPFVPGVGPKPVGARFYPADMSKEEFEQKIAESPELEEALKSQYTLVRRTEEGELYTVPYREAFADDIAVAVERLKAVVGLAEDPGFKNYIEMRAEALLTDDYQPSDMAWMDMKDNRIEVVIGPIETYEDRLYGYKAAHECFILVKDLEWSQRLAKYARLLPGLQKSLPVPERYKREEPGSESELNAYDVLYYAGDCNAGSKTIAINLPNDEEVQLQKGARRLQLKNAMRAKFDKILTPIAELLIAEDQRQHISFDAFFNNGMFHEVAHGLGIKNTLTEKGTVREALKDQASAFEEGKADILGLYMIVRLAEAGELDVVDVKDNYVTFMTSIFRSIRFGPSRAHGRANLMRFNFFKEYGAFERDDESGTYRVNVAKMEEAMNALAERILTMQGDGDYEAAEKMWEQYGKVGSQLQTDLNRLAAAGIPTDVIFEQGMSVLNKAN